MREWALNLAWPELGPVALSLWIKIPVWVPGGVFEYEWGDAEKLKLKRQIWLLLIQKALIRFSLGRTEIPLALVICCGLQWSAAATSVERYKTQASASRLSVSSVGGYDAGHIWRTGPRWWNMTPNAFMWRSLIRPCPLICLRVQRKFTRALDCREAAYKFCKALNCAANFSAVENISRPAHACGEHTHDRKVLPVNLADI